jgi:hypothetical protein
MAIAVREGIRMKTDMKPLAAIARIAALCGALLIVVPPRFAMAAEIVWTLQDAVLQYDNRYPFVADLSGTFTINSSTGALDSYQFYTSTAVFNFGGGDAFFSGAQYPGPQPGATISTATGCPVSFFCFFGPPVATAGATSLQVGYADDEPVSGFLPDYVVHVLTLDFSGPLTDPGTISLLGSSNEYNGFNGFTRYVTSGEATSPAPLPAALPLFATGLGMMGWFVRRRKRTTSGALAAA